MAGKRRVLTKEVATTRARASLGVLVMSGSTQTYRLTALLTPPLSSASLVQFLYLDCKKRKIE